MIICFKFIQAMAKVKTTAAIGLAIRSLGADKKSLFFANL